MILYSSLDGDAITTSIKIKPRHCFLITQLGQPISAEVKKIQDSLEELCISRQYTPINAGTKITGRDFLLKIWKLIAATPLSIGISHEEIPVKTQMNIYYEIGVAQALGKETIIIKSSKSEIPSDFVRSEYIVYDKDFSKNFLNYLESVDEQAEHYELVADQLDNNPVLEIDYLRRAFLITGNPTLQKRAQKLLTDSNLNARSKNSVEKLAANFANFEPTK